MPKAPNSSCRCSAPIRRADLGQPEQLVAVDMEWISQSPYSQIVRRDVSSSEVELLSQPDFLAGRRRLVKLGLEAGDWGENVYRDH